MTNIKQRLQGVLEFPWRAPLADHDARAIARDALAEIERLERYVTIPPQPIRLGAAFAGGGIDPYDTAPLWAARMRT